MTDYAAELESLTKPPKAVIDAARSGRKFVATQTSDGKVNIEYPGSFDYAGELEGLTKPSNNEIPPPFPGMKPEIAAPAGPSTPYQAAGGVVEPALSAITGAAAVPLASLAGIGRRLFYGGSQEESGQTVSETLRDLTYQPRTQAGQENTAAIGKVMGALPPVLGTPALNIPTAVRGVGKASREAEGVGPASVGAAAITGPEAAKAAVASASPELRAMVEQAVAKGEPISPPALARHVEADSLPVPVQLTKGQATGDVVTLSNEQNQRGKNPAFAQRFNDQNKALTQNIPAIREIAAPDVYATTKPEHGEILIDAYRSKDAALNADIGAKYKALTDANGGQLPLDGRAFVEQANAALHKGLLYDHVPDPIRATLNRIQDKGSMTFENFESLRTNLARVQRSNQDGNAVAAAGVIRQALEDLPMPPGAENLKPLADAARAAARERFALIEKDPAYKAVVTGKAVPDNFIDKFVINAPVEGLQTLKVNLNHDNVAQQAIASGTLDYLKGAAGVANDTGNFSQAGYNKALQKLRERGKLPVIFEPEVRQHVETLGNVAAYTQAQPRGSYVNNSNTAVTLLKEGAKSGIEGAANYAAGGVPIGTWSRRALQTRAEKKATQETLKPGAGILLRDVGK